MSKSVTQVFLDVAETDRELAGNINRKLQIKDGEEEITDRLAGKKQELERVEKSLAEAREARTEMESKLKEEEQKIAERRKQLMSIGSLKAAKLIERDIEASSKFLGGIKDDLGRVANTASELEESQERLKVETEEVQVELDSFVSDNKSTISDLSSAIKTGATSRQELVTSMSERARRLYGRVSQRYPGDAISLAQDGACQSCFRALPFQLFNQVLTGGTLIQCPGCSRILVAAEQKQ